MRVISTSISILALAVLSATAFAYPPDFADTRYVSGLAAPVALAFVPDGRLFIAELTGSVRVAQVGGTLLPTPAIQLDVENFEEQGLLGMAFHPAFPDSPYVYLLYTPNKGTSTFNRERISRFVVAGDQFVAASETILSDVLPTGYGYHVGGCLRVSPALEIFASNGDNGHGHTVSFAQDLDHLEGKLIRLTTGGAVPPDNPFVNVPGARPEIYHRGLRNPFRFSLQPGTGIPFVSDTGEYAWEEINSGPPGCNFGWPDSEGPESPPAAGVTNPFYAYVNSPGASIVGSVFHPGPGFPAGYAGNLFYLDHSRGKIGRLTLNANNTVATAEPNWGTAASAGWFSGPVDITVSPDGALYYSTLDPAEVHGVAWLGVAGVGNAPARAPVMLSANVPNPFSSSTRLEFTLPAGGAVRLEVLDPSGRRVRMLVDASLDAGHHAAIWDRRDDAGHELPPGVYMARLTRGDASAVRRMIVWR